MKTLQDIPDLNGKKVIVRVDFNVPLDDDGNVRSDKRIKLSLPTIKHLLDGGAKQLILMTHVGRPKKFDPKLKTDKIAHHLGELIGQSVVKVDDWGENGLPEAKVVMLENLRFHPGEKSKEEAERDEFGKQLASLADLYVNDAFSNCHRAHASMTSVPKFIPGYAGLGVENEMEQLNRALANPEHPVVAVIGGLKGDKLRAVRQLLKSVDQILMAGALSFTLLKAQGYSMGDSKIDDEGLEEMAEIVKEVQASDKVMLPVDAVVADAFSNDANSKVVPVDSVEDGWMALDIGPETIKKYIEVLKGAKTILWFGPIGVFEMKKFSLGTEQIGEVIAQSDAISIVGGGDSASAVEKLGLKDQMTLVSTGGGASLRLFEGEELPAIKVLN